MNSMRRVLRDNGIGLVFGGLFLLMLLGQAISGQMQYNDQQVAYGSEPVSFLQYVMS